MVSLQFLSFFMIASRPAPIIMTSILLSPSYRGHVGGREPVRGERGKEIIKPSRFFCCCCYSCFWGHSRLLLGGRQRAKDLHMHAGRRQRQPQEHSPLHFKLGAVVDHPFSSGRLRSSALSNRVKGPPVSGVTITGCVPVASTMLLRMEVVVVRCPFAQKHRPLHA